jgi:hypothetical protein
VKCTAQKDAPPLTALRAALSGSGKQQPLKGVSQMRNVPHEIEKIINVANELACNGSTGGSTSEVIAAAFVLDRMEFLPNGYTVIEAWERLDNWQPLVKKIKAEYQDLLVPW